MSELPLSDRLALERTRLAAERTALAYARTAFALLAGALTLVNVFEAPETVPTALVLVVIAVALLVGGARRYRTVVRLLRAAEGSLGG